MLIYYLIGGVIILLIIGIWIVIRIVKKRKKKKLMENPPEELVKELNQISNEFERRNIKDGKTNPYQILWEHAKRKNIGQQNSRIAIPERTIENRKLHAESTRRQDIQGIPYTRDKESNPRDRKPKRNSSRNFFSRFRRR